MEVAAVTGALQSMCPLQLTLDRVIVNRGGVVMACWQVSRGSTTAAVRDALQVRLVSGWVQHRGGVGTSSQHFHCTATGLHIKRPPPSAVSLRHHQCLGCKLR